MNEKKKALDEIIIKPLDYKDSIDLINAGYPFSRATLKRSLLETFFQTINFHRRETRFVAYHTNRKRAVGSLFLEMHTKQLYSIRYVFSDPEFRQRGIATELVRYSLTFAKKRGAKRVFLSAEPLSTASRIYQKFGFRPVLKNSVVSGAGKTFFQFDNTKHLLKPHSISQENRSALFDVYAGCLGQDFIDFFDINKYNFVNGYSQDFRYLFRKRVFINDLADSLALVFTRPLTHTSSIELHSRSDSFFSDMIKTLNRILYKQGMNYLTINALNVKSGASLTSLLENRQFHPYQSILMGLSL